MNKHNQSQQPKQQPINKPQQNQQQNKQQQQQQTNNDQLKERWRTLNNEPLYYIQPNTDYKEYDPQTLLEKMGLQVLRKNSDQPITRSRALNLIGKGDRPPLSQDYIDTNKQAYSQLNYLWNAIQVYQKIAPSMSRKLMDEYQVLSSYMNIKYQPTQNSDYICSKCSVVLIPGVNCKVRIINRKNISNSRISAIQFPTNSEADDKQPKPKVRNTIVKSCLTCSSSKVLAGGPKGINKSKSTIKLPTTVNDKKKKEEKQVTPQTTNQSTKPINNNNNKPDNSKIIPKPTNTATKRSISETQGDTNQSSTTSTITPITKEKEKEKENEKKEELHVLKKVKTDHQSNQTPTQTISKPIAKQPTPKQAKPTPKNSKKQAPQKKANLSSFVNDISSMFK